MPPLITVIIPAYNEAEAIGRCLDSLAAQEYPLDRLEVIVADGGSRDGTRQAAAGYQEKLPRFRLLDNPGRTAPAALNLGIKAAQGEIVIRLDAHCFVPPDFISKNAAVLSQVPAEVVGGPITTVGRGYLGQAIALVLSSPFGVGDSYFRFAKTARYVDTLAFGACRRELFDRVGTFNERLTRNQDIEFNQRIRRAGGRIWLTPEIKSFYQCRSSLTAFIRQNWANGCWNIRTRRLAGQALSLRHFIPLVFVTSLLVLAGLGLFWLPARFLFGLELALYFSAALAAAWIGTRDRGRRRFLPVLPFLFFVFHASYGLGSLRAVLDPCLRRDDTRTRG